MLVKINPIVNVIGKEELIVIPIVRNGDFLLALNFYEDVQGGRLARLVLIQDKYSELKEGEESAIRGDKAVVFAEGVEEDYRKLQQLIRIDRYLRSNRIPLFINIEVLKDVDITEKGVKGYINYISRYGKIDAKKLVNALTLDVEIK